MVSGGVFWLSSSFVFLLSSFLVYLSVCCVNQCSLFFFLLVLGGFFHPRPETCHQFFVEKDKKGIFVGKFRVRGHIYICIYTFSDLFVLLRASICLLIFEFIVLFY